MALLSGGCCAAVRLNGDAGVTSIVADYVVTVPDTDVERRSKFLNIYTAFLLLAVVAVRLRIKDEGLPSPRSSPVKRRRYARSDEM